MKTVVVIINFDSLFPEFVFENSSSDIEDRIRMVLSHILENDLDVEYVKVRLYGNWYEGLSFTKRTSTLLQMLADVRLFPMIRPPKSLIQGEILITRQLYGASAAYSWDMFLADVDNSGDVEFVDTMITCNMISYSMDAEVSSLYLFTNELRHLPAIGIISKLFRKPKVEILTSDEQKASVINRMFNGYNVSVFHLKL